MAAIKFLMSFLEWFCGEQSPDNSNHCVHRMEKKTGKSQGPWTIVIELVFERRVKPEVIDVRKRIKTSARIRLKTRRRLCLPNGRCVCTISNCSLTVYTARDGYSETNSKCEKLHR